MGKNFALFAFPLLACMLLSCFGCKTQQVEEPQILYGQTSYLNLEGYRMVEDRIDVRNMNELADPTRWDASHCTVAVSNMTADGHPALHWTIPVDYNTGGQAQMQDWPNININLNKDELDWEPYDRFEFMVYTGDFALPAEVMTFATSTLSQKTTRVVLESGILGKAGFWNRVNILTSNISEVADVARIGFFINELNYKDKQVLDFHIGGFKLFRSSKCAVLEMTAKPAFIYQDAELLKVEVIVSGPESEMAKGVPMELRRGDNVIKRSIVPVTHGRIMLNLPIAGLDLVPDDYELTAFPDNPERCISVALKVLNSPWNEDN